MTLLFLRFVLFCLIAVSTAAIAVPQTPAIMVFQGKVHATGALNSASPGIGDTVVVFGLSDGQLAGSGTVNSKDGEFTAVVAKNASFNGQMLVFEMQQGRKRYRLLLDNGTAAVMAFAGRMLPERTTLMLGVGSQTAELSAMEAATAGAQRLSQRTDLPCDAQSDINEDGRCDDADLRILRLYGGGVARTVGRP